MLASSQFLLLFVSTSLLPFITLAAASNSKPMKDFFAVNNYESPPVQLIRDESPNPLFNLNSSFFPLGGLIGITTDIPGLVTPFGIQQVEAMISAINEVNQSPDILNTTQIVYTIYDTRESVSEALGGTISLSVSNVTCIVGPNSVEQALECANFAYSKNVSLISYSAPSIDLDARNLYPFARLETNDAEQARGIVALIQALGWGLIVPLFSNDTYGLSGRSEFYASAANTNITFTCEALIPTSFNEDDILFAESALKNISQCVASSIANVVLVYTDLTDAAAMLASLQSFPENDRLTFIASDDWVKLGDDPSLFSLVSGFPLSFIEGTVGLLPTPGNISVFKNHFYSLSPENNPYAQFSTFWEYSFNCFLSNDTSIPFCSEFLNERNTTAISCRCIGNENLTSVPIDSSVGYVYDIVFSFASALDRIISNCSSIKFGNYCDLTAVTGSQIFDVVVAFPRDGVTGPIRISGINRLGGSFDVVQLDASGVQTDVGNYTNDVITIDQSALHFKSPGQPKSDIILADTSQTSIPGLFVIAIALLSIFVCLCTSLYLYRHRRNKIIKKSSPVFCQLILLGMIMVYLGLILWSLVQTQLLCILKVWIIIIGFGLIIGNLLAKTYRIFKIFSNIKVTTTAIRDRSLFKFSLAIILFEVLLLSIYTFATGLPDAVLMISPTDPLYSFVSCRAFNSTFQTAMVAIILTFNVLLILAAGLIAYLTRHVDSAYSESNYIGYTVYCYIILIVITFPIYFTDGDGTGSATRKYIERSVSVIFAMTFTWLALFGPKLRTLYRQRRLTAKMSSSTRKTSISVYARSVSSARASSTDVIVGIDSDRVTRGDRFITAPLWRNRIVADRVTRSYFPLQATSPTVPPNISPSTSAEILPPSSSTSLKLFPIYEALTLISEGSVTEAPNGPDWMTSESYTLTMATQTEDTENSDTKDSILGSL